MTHAPKGILALDPGYKLSHYAGLVYIEPFDDGGYDVDWVAITPKVPEPKPEEKRRTLKSLTKDERMASVLEQVNTFSQKYIGDIATITTYHTAFGFAANGLSHLNGMFRGWGWMNSLKNYQSFGDTTVKAAIANNGRASKEQVRKVIVEGRKLWPGCPEILDVSDAFALAYYVMDRRRRGLKT